MNGISHLLRKRKPLKDRQPKFSASTSKTVDNGEDSCSDNANANQDVSKETQSETNNLEKVKSENES